MIREGAVPEWNPSNDWSQGGPIIEREDILFSKSGLSQYRASIDLDEGDVMTKACNGPTPLIAAMRCYVASTLGDEVEIPEELA
jgi:hypothetical protein